MRIVSCCGVVCTDCVSYPNECMGCPAVEGGAYWLQYVEDDCCPVYACCVRERRLAHCGLCREFPCDRYDRYEDPTVSREEAAEARRKQVALLKGFARGEPAGSGR